MSATCMRVSDQLRSLGSSVLYSHEGSTSKQVPVTDGLCMSFNCNYGLCFLCIIIALRSYLISYNVTFLDIWSWQMQAAAAAGVRICVFIGEEEIRQQQLSWKCMASGKQHVEPLPRGYDAAHVADLVRQLIASL